MKSEQQIEEMLEKPFYGFFEFLVNKELDKGWFRWLEWVTITAAFYALGRKTESIVLMGVAFFSFILLFFRAWMRLEGLMKRELIPRMMPQIASWPSFLSIVFIIIVFILFMSIPFFVVVFLGETIRSVMPDVKSTS